MTHQETGTTGIAADRQAALFCDDPVGFFDHSYTKMHSISRAALGELQQAGLRHRFAQLRDTLPMLAKLAGSQGISALETLDDAVPLLFEHTMYKSYPPALLEKGRFAEINRFLSKLTTHDLTRIDVSACEGIDDWLDVMDRESPLRICHSSGSSGVMSFIPTSKAEWDRFGETQRVQCLQDFGSAPSEGDEALHCIYPYFQNGGSSHLRANQMTIDHLLDGAADRFFAAYPIRMSSDVLYLAARLRAAQAKGELDRVQVSPRLLARRQEFEDLEVEMPARLEAFFDRVVSELKGKRIYIAATWNIAYAMARKGLDRGLVDLFAANSVLISGGGAKGMTPPPDWKEVCCTFFNAKQVKMAYAMTEVFGMHFSCAHGQYHFAPWVIPYVLDPETSEPLPRSGVVTGRAAFFDLSADTRWGGFITGDEITVNWDEPCRCGRTSAYIVGEIRRYSEMKGGDDKISCAATEDAHADAMDFLTGLQ